MQPILVTLLVLAITFLLSARREKSIKNQHNLVLQKRLLVLKVTQELGFKEELQLYAQEMGIEDNNSDLTISRFVRMKGTKGAIRLDWSSRFCPRQARPKQKQHDSRLVKRMTTKYRFLALHHAVYLEITRMKGDRSNGEVFIFASK